MELEIVEQTSTVSIEGGATVEIVSPPPATVTVETGGAALVVEVDQPTVTISDDSVTVEVPVVQPSVSLAAPGPQGPSGPAGTNGAQQFFVGGSQPTYPGVPVLWFKPFGGADPNDYTMEVITS